MIHPSSIRLALALFLMASSPGQCQQWKGITIKDETFPSQPRSPDDEYNIMDDRDGAGVITAQVKQRRLLSTCISDVNTEKAYCVEPQSCTPSTRQIGRQPQKLCYFMAATGKIPRVCCPVSSIVSVSQHALSRHTILNTSSKAKFGNFSPIQMSYLSYGYRDVNVPNCGQTVYRTGRIIGGRIVRVASHPWIVLFYFKNKRFCSGALFNNVHVLTAAHCMARFNNGLMGALTVKLGEHNVNIPNEPGEQIRKVIKMTIHPGFKNTFMNDIAIITLSSPVLFGPKIQPICLSTSMNDHAGRIATIAGWGIINNRLMTAEQLRAADILVWTNKQCAMSYGAKAPGGIPSQVLCAGSPGQDSCGGDSGGPLTIYDGYKYEQIGIVSWGIGCAVPNYPGVYTRVNHFIDWIRSNT